MSTAALCTHTSSGNSAVASSQIAIGTANVPLRRGSPRFGTSRPAPQLAPRLGPSALPFQRRREPSVIERIHTQAACNRHRRPTGASQASVTSTQPEESAAEGDGLIRGSSRNAVRLEMLHRLRQQMASR
jgi:hypothetical protein